MGLASHHIPRRTLCLDFTVVRASKRALTAPSNHGGGGSRSYPVSSTHAKMLSPPATLQHRDRMRHAARHSRAQKQTSYGSKSLMPVAKQTQMCWSEHLPRSKTLSNSSETNLSPFQPYLNTTNLSPLHTGNQPAPHSPLPRTTTTPRLQILTRNASLYNHTCTNTKLSQTSPPPPSQTSPPPLSPTSPLPPSQISPSFNKLHCCPLHKSSTKETLKIPPLLGRG